MKRQRSPTKSQQSPAKCQFRLIAGKHRGRKLTFPVLEALRPTPDRVRETLFNWLSDELNQSTCLDLFAGSGALGLECLSRGAKNCIFIDAHPQAQTAISAHLSVLKESGQAMQGELPASLSHLHDKHFDIIFIDPPYANAYLIISCLNQLVQQDNIKHGAAIYIEHSSEDARPPLSDDFQLHRTKKTGQVQSSLLYYLPRDAINSV